LNSHNRKIYRNHPHLIVKSWFPVGFPIHQSIDCYFSHSRYPEGYIVLVGVFRLEPLTKKQVSSDLMLPWSDGMPRSVPSHWWMPQEFLATVQLMQARWRRIDCLLFHQNHVMPCRASGDIRGHPWSVLPNCHQLPIYPSWVRH
jgi:hypothetical protein